MLSWNTALRWPSIIVWFQCGNYLSNAKKRIPRMNNDHVSLYSEETNAENSAGLVVHLFRIVPHIHSALFSTLYMGKRSAIEILLIKQEPCFPNVWKNGGTWLGKIRRSYLCIDTQPPLWVGIASYCSNPNYSTNVLFFQLFFVPLHPKHQEQTLARVDSPTEQ